MSLHNKICLVTGASRGIGRGIALALGSEGATVYITGRTLELTSKAPGSLNITAEEVNARGGVAIPVQCDHGVDEEIHRLFDKIKKDHGRIDLLVNNAYKGVNTIIKNSPVPFWEQPVESWDDCIHVGLRCHFIAAQDAAKMMVNQKDGLIVNVSSAGALFNFFTTPYGVGKAGLDKMSEMCGKELKEHNVTCVSLWPGLVQTETLMAAKDQLEKNEIEGVKLKMSRGETVEYAGRAIVGLMNDKNLPAKSGKTIGTADLGAEYGFTDVDGRTHSSMRSVKRSVAIHYPWLASFIPAFIKVPWALLVAMIHHYY